MSQSLYKKVGLASAIMMSSVFLSRLFGILREMVIAYLGGTGVSVDAYQVSFILPEILNHILASGFLSITFIPIFTNYLASNREPEAWRVFSNILNCFGALLIVLIVLTFVFTDELIGLTGLDSAGSAREAIRMSRIILPAQFFFFAGGLLMAVQFAKEKFLIPALAPLIYNLMIIVGGVLLFPVVGMSGFSWGVLAGAALGNFLIQWFGARRCGLTYSFCFRLKDRELRNYVVVTLPLMLGLTMTFSTEIFPKLFGSFLSPGSVSALNYSLRIMFLLVGLFGQAVGAASYPYLSRLVSENRLDEMNQLLNRTLKSIALVIPFSALIVVARYEIVFILFQRGSFDARSTELTAGILVYLMIGTFAFTAQTIVNRGYYAQQNTLFPSLYVSAAVIITLPLYYLGMHYMDVNGIALALSLSTILQVILLFALWNRRSSNSGGISVYRFYLKVIAISLVIAGILQGLKTRLMSPVPSDTLLGNFLSLSALTMICLVLILGSGYLFRLEELFELTHRVIQRIRPRR